jgi:glycosyltransferase involved in cell wall biosynthesis
MSEYVHHQINGLLFKHRDVEDLANKMESFIKEPTLASRLGARGYIKSEDGNVVDISMHVRKLEKLYRQTISDKGAQYAN